MSYALRHWNRESSIKRVNFVGFLEALKKFVDKRESDRFMDAYWGGNWYIDIDGLGECSPVDFAIAVHWVAHVIKIDLLTANWFGTGPIHIIDDLYTHGGYDGEYEQARLIFEEILQKEFNLKPTDWEFRKHFKNPNVVYLINKEKQSGN